MNFNPYLVLDVPMSADFDTLRATYRRLARENHPDVASDKARATERMAQINRAWGILGDTHKRAEWDGDWRRHNLEEARRESLRREAAQREIQQREAAQRESARSRRAPVSPSKTASRAGSNSGSGSGARQSPKRGAGGTSRAGSSATATRGSGSARRAGSNENHFPDSASPQALRLMRKITLAARVFHRDGNAKSAIEMCRAVLLADGRNVPARELLSEIFASQGRLEIAVMMLDQAIQLAPDDLFLRRKRDHLENSRFPGGALRPVKRPGLWQRLRAQFQRRSGGAEERRR